jgi:hypothetical protein
VGQISLACARKLLILVRLTWRPPQRAMELALVISVTEVFPWLPSPAI